MYTVHIQNECKCFKKSEYSNNKSFETQKDAYAYAQIITEFINEEFCGQHIFTAHRGEENSFVISSIINVEKVTGVTPHITCDTGCTSTDKWSLESADKNTLQTKENQ